MKLKLDENLGERIACLFRIAGHDVETILQERMSGATDEDVFSVCIQEKRCLVTLDLDFSDPIRFPSEKTEGILILRPPKQASFASISRLAEQACIALQSMSPLQVVWVVEPGRIRIHQRLEDS